jgi:pimeloyl-ACP methyl ester carboxylesterase
MDHRKLLYKTSSISYYRFGSGPQTAICFHGYGEDGRMYSFFEASAGLDFSFFAIELPFHGHTEWNEGLDFTSRDLQEIVSSILETEERTLSDPRHNIVLLGFSLGGRVALSLYQLLPDRFGKLLLMAPDGLKVNGWYWLATQSYIGNRFFALTMDHPQWFFGLLKFLNSLKLVNTSIFKFVNYYIGDKQARDLLYMRWTSLRKLKPALGTIKKYVRQHHTKIRLVYGKHDRIILPVVGEKFRRGIEDHCSITIIHSGHQILHENHLNELLPVLMH